MVTFRIAAGQWIDCLIDCVSQLMEAHPVTMDYYALWTPCRETRDGFRRAKAQSILYSYKLRFIYCFIIMFVIDAVVPVCLTCVAVW